MELPQVLSIMKQTCQAIGAAGEAGIVHRDIKPENILVTKRGRVKVADFGKLCRDQALEVQAMTQSNVTMGTPLYMSPEQAQGHPVDHRSDLYSLGVTYYFMIAGEPPVPGRLGGGPGVEACPGDPQEPGEPSTGSAPGNRPAGDEADVEGPGGPLPVGRHGPGRPGQDAGPGPGRVFRGDLGDFRQHLNSAVADESSPPASRNALAGRARPRPPRRSPPLRGPTVPSRSRPSRSRVRRPLRESRARTSPPLVSACSWRRLPWRSA